jgi:hypothetical protein
MGMDQSPTQVGLEIKSTLLPPSPGSSPPLTSGPRVLFLHSQRSMGVRLERLRGPMPVMDLCQNKNNRQNHPSKMRTVCICVEKRSACRDVKSEQETTSRPVSKLLVRGAEFRLAPTGYSEAT